jgi:hypothetical protein
MPQNNNIEITNDDIIYAEKVLLKEWQFFDTERRDFIKNLDTIDLQAVPWSWKTTALLAKLLILERKMPFSDWSGILVLSHTNTAVDEIKERIWKVAPKLFDFPNFIWTIQSFVDEFLAKPYHSSKTSSGLNFIDSDRYKNLIEKMSYLFYSWINQSERNKINHIKNWNPKLYYECYLTTNDDNIELHLDWKKVVVNKPRGNTRPQNYIDYTNQEKNMVYKAIIQMKNNLILNWNLSFDDAYFLWDRYIEKFPRIKKILQSRFKYVFVDEMQDMWEHQINILEKLFYKKYVLNHSFQRIWDINQAIYWWIVKEENFWENIWRKKLKLAGTHRLTQKVADVVKNFWLDYIDFVWNRKIIDSEWNDISKKPILLVYDDSHLNNIAPEIKGNKILEKYSSIIKEFKDNWFFWDSKFVSKAIIWSAKSDIERNWDLKFELDKCRAKHYFYDYDVLWWKSKNKTWFNNEKDFLVFYNKEDKSYKSKYNNIINLFLKILRFNGIKNINEKYFNKTSLLKYLRENFEKEYIEFKIHIFNWSKKLNDSNIDDIAEEIDDFFPNIIELLPENKRVFLNIKDSIPTEWIIINSDDDKKMNIYSNNWIDITIWTVHSVKGETHTCTLYMESSSYWNESFPKLKGKPYLWEKLSGSLWIRSKEALKMLYVWLSRPTHLLCYAIHKDRYKELIDWEWNKDKLIKLWKVEPLTWLIIWKK